MADQGYFKGRFFLNTDCAVTPHRPSTSPGAAVDMEDLVRQVDRAFAALDEKLEAPRSRGAIAKAGARLSLAIVGGFVLLMLIAALS